MEIKRIVAKCQTTINLAMVKIVRQGVPIDNKITFWESGFEQVQVPYLSVSFIPHFSLLSTISFVNPFTPIAKII